MQNDGTSVVKVVIHTRGHPEGRAECLIEHAKTGERLIATWNPVSGLWQTHDWNLPAGLVSVWVPLNQIFEAL